eukprot:gene6251-6489_t
MAERRCHSLEDENQRLREENERLRDELQFLRSENMPGRAADLYDLTTNMDACTHGLSTL